MNNSGDEICLGSFGSSDCNFLDSGKYFFQPCWVAGEETLGKLESLQKLLSNDLRIFKHPFSPGMEQLTTGGKRFEAREKEAFSKERLWRVSSLERFESLFISGIVGGRAPSRYAESPQFLNPYFRELSADGVFFTFDLPAEGDLDAFLRDPGSSRPDRHRSL